MKTKLTPVLNWKKSLKNWMIWSIVFPMSVIESNNPKICSNGNNSNTSRQLKQHKTKHSCTMHHKLNDASTVVTHQSDVISSLCSAVRHFVHQKQTMLQLNNRCQKKGDANDLFCPGMENFPMVQNVGLLDFGCK